MVAVTSILRVRGLHLCCGRHWQELLIGGRPAIMDVTFTWLSLGRRGGVLVMTRCSVHRGRHHVCPDCDPRYEGAEETRTAAHRQQVNALELHPQDGSFSFQRVKTSEHRFKTLARTSMNDGLFIAVSDDSAIPLTI